MKLDSHKLNPTTKIKYVGMHIDENMSWHVHTKELGKK